MRPKTTLKQLEIDPGRPPGDLSANHEFLQVAPSGRILDLPIVYPASIRENPERDNLPAKWEQPRLWRTLEEGQGVAPTPDDSGVDLENYWTNLDLSSRREFLRLMVASLALGGLSGCAIEPAGQIVPYVEAPEQIVPGQPLFFATALALGGFACGVLVESHTGRPTKIEGNSNHPASLGATDLFAQAEILSLYDPDRSQVAIHEGHVETWAHAQDLLLNLREHHRVTKGRGLRILTRTLTSPTIADQFRRLAVQLPESKWHGYDPISRDNVRAGCRLAFGQDLEPVYHLDQADVIFALDADFLSWGPGRLKDARAFIGRRAPEQDAGPVHTGSNLSMNRLYVVEPTPTITGASADHRFPVSSRDIAAIAQDLARELGVSSTSGLEGPTAPAPPSSWVVSIAKDLKAAGNRSLVVVGDTQPAEVHAIAHQINDVLGGTGRTILFLPRSDIGPSNQMNSMQELVQDIDAGSVDTLIILGGNPAYDAPADLDFTKRLLSRRVKLSIHLSSHDNETSRLCNWHIPEAHALETWGDLRAFDGTVSIQQPLIEPLFGGKSAIEVMETLVGDPGRPGREIVREYWRRSPITTNFDEFWRIALQKGVMDGTAHKPVALTAKPQPVLTATPALPPGDNLEILFRPDATIWDGTYANNSWLQETPSPLTRFTWDNAAFLSPSLARERNIKNEDMIELRHQGRSITLPAWIMPGQAEHSVTVTLGYGRTRAGRVGDGVGVDVNPLRLSDNPWFQGGLELFKTGTTQTLAQTQHHFSMEGREAVRAGTITDFQANPKFAKIHEQDHERGPTLFEDPEPQKRREEGFGNAWGMAIDLNKCIGCSACVVACQAENNIPVVGREQVLASRELHWIRIDRYFEGENLDNPEIDFQPVPCMHCEKAPCELVCPVGATTHSAEGLNEMTYNRCVGTRYCSNNCPYKVRRFNFFHYSDDVTPSLKLQRNPDVSVRTRGVMEKCTYCVQRITAARIAAEYENRPVRGNEVITACQGVCPTRAITFGNLNDPESEVVKAKASPRNYGLLAELNTRPRTSYLARLRNPNPELEARPRDHENAS